MMNERQNDLVQAAKDEHVASYREKIIDMVEQIENERFLKMIFGYVSSAYKEKTSRD